MWTLLSHLEVLFRVEQCLILPLFPSYGSTHFVTYLPMQIQMDTKGPTAILLSGVPPADPCYPAMMAPSGLQRLSDGELTWNIQDKHQSTSILYLSEQLRVEKASRMRTQWATSSWYPRPTPAPGSPTSGKPREGKNCTPCHHRPDCQPPRWSPAAAGARGGLQAQGLSAGDQQAWTTTASSPTEGSMCRAPPARWRRLLIQQPVHRHQTRPSPDSPPSLPAAEVLGEQSGGLVLRALLGQKMKEELREVKMVHLKPAGSYQSLREQYLTCRASLEFLQSRKVQVRLELLATPGLWGGMGCIGVPFLSSR